MNKQQVENVLTRRHAQFIHTFLYRHERGRVKNESSFSTRPLHSLYKSIIEYEKHCRHIVTAGQCLFHISVGIVRLPAPCVRAHVLKVLFCGPAQDLPGLRGVGIACSDIAGAAGIDDIGKLLTAGFR